jgi:hypothetical protein
MLVVSESESDETIFWNFKVSFEMDDQSQITSKISNYSKKYMTLVRDFNFIQEIQFGRLCHFKRIHLDSLELQEFLFNLLWSIVQYFECLSSNETLG